MNRKIPSRAGDQKGSALIFVIIGMVVVAVLAAGLFSMTSTSAFNQAEAQKDAKAYYISESCIRITASEYKAATAANKNSKLLELHGKTFIMPNNQGSCTVEIYPYWFYSPAAIPLGTNPITLYMPGAVPRISADETSEDYKTSVTFPDKGFLRVKDLNRIPPWSGTTELQYTSCSNCAPPYTVGNNGTALTFTLNTPLTNATIIGDEFYLGYEYTPATLPVTLNAGDSLVLNTDTNDQTAKMFPPEKGSILFKGHPSESEKLYQYDARIINASTTPRTVTLTNIRAIPGAPVELNPTFPVTISSNPTIYTVKSIGFRAESHYGN